MNTENNITEENNESTALVATETEVVHEAVVIEAEDQLLKTKRTDLLHVDPRKVEVEEGFNVRIEYGDIPSLAKSIVAIGIIDPLVGFKKRGEDKFVMTEGHRRLAAIHYAMDAHAKGKEGFEDMSKIALIPMRMDSANLKDRLYIMGVTGEKKKPLTDLEKVRMYVRLIELGQEEGKKKSEVINEIKERLGLSHATVYNTLKLNELPEEIKESIGRNDISSGTALSIIREIKEPAEQVKAVKEAIAHAQLQAATLGLKSKATARNVKNLKVKSPMSRLNDVAETLAENGIDNKKSQFFLQIMEMLEKKRSVASILELFVE